MPPFTGRIFSTDPPPPLGVLDLTILIRFACALFYLMCGPIPRHFYRVLLIDLFLSCFDSPFALRLRCLLCCGCLACFFLVDVCSGDGLTHLYYQPEPLFPFGHGLSYTTFTYEWSPSALAKRTLHIISDDTIDGDGLGLGLGLVSGRNSVGYECTVTNTGQVAGDAVILGFANSTDPQYPRQKVQVAQITKKPNCRQ